VKSPWSKVQGEDGSSYYWNQDTDETAWDKPDGYVSGADSGLSEAEQKERTEKIVKMQNIARGRKARKEAVAKKAQKQKEEQEKLDKAQAAQKKEASDLADLFGGLDDAVDAPATLGDEIAKAEEKVKEEIKTEAAQKKVLLLRFNQQLFLVFVV